MAPKLEKTFTLRAYLDKENMAPIGAVKGGAQRTIVPINKGFLEGSGVKAELLPGSGDWLLLDPSTNVAHLDVRGQARTANGHFIHFHYRGIVKVDSKAGKVFSFASDAGTTEYGDHHWFNAPVMETSDPELKWVENEVWLGEGRFVVDEQGSAVEYEVYRVTN